MVALNALYIVKSDSPCNHYHHHGNKRATHHNLTSSADRAHRATLHTRIFCLPRDKDIAKSLRRILASATTGVHQVDGALAQWVGLTELPGSRDGRVQLGAKLGLQDGGCRTRVRYAITIGGHWGCNTEAG
jgi:hypothetical protein